MCFSNPNWKREEVPDHKFDFIDVDEYENKSIFIRVRYLWVYMVVLKSVLVYMSDLYTAGSLIAFNHWATAPAKIIPLDIARWIFAGSIIFSVLLLLWDMKKARAIIASRDISYAFTSIIAYRYYTLRSYAHYCFFRQINNSRKTSDNITYYVFFTFKGWKRLLLAEGPRQAINGITLIEFVRAYLETDRKHSIGSFFTTYFDDQGALMQHLVLMSMAFSVIIFAISIFQLAIAFFCYIPLVCYIQGNLKEYTCHMIDKRIAELVRKKRRQRIKKAEAQARKEAMGLKNKKGDYVVPPKQKVEPTLPNVDVYQLDEYDTDSYDPPPPGHLDNTLPYGYGYDNKGVPYPYETAPSIAPSYGYEQNPYGYGAMPQPGTVSEFDSKSQYDATVFDMYKDPNDAYYGAQPHPYLDDGRTMSPAPPAPPSNYGGDIYDAQLYDVHAYPPHPPPQPTASRTSDRSMHSQLRYQSRFEDPVDRTQSPYSINSNSQGSMSRPAAVQARVPSFMSAGDRQSIMSRDGSVQNHHDIRRGLTQAINRERAENDAQWGMQPNNRGPGGPGGPGWL